MALKQAFRTVHRLVYRDADNKRVVVPAGKNDFYPENAKQRDALLASGAIRPLKAPALSPEEKAAADKAAADAKAATGDGDGDGDGDNA